MKRIGTSLLLFLLCSPVFAQSTYQHYIVGTRVHPRAVADDVLANDLPEMPWRSRAKALHSFISVDAFEADLTWNEAQALKKRADVAYVEEDLPVHMLSDSVTPGSETTPYGVTMVNAPEVWPVTKGKAVGGGSPIHVAIIDTGISYDHPELATAYKGGFNEVNGTTDPRDDNGHGTHVAGTIAAAMNGDGVVGVAPDVDLYSVKVLDSCGSGFTTTILRGVDWVIQKKQEIGGNWIMSLSLGSDTASPSEASSFQNAYNAGILTFAASGNGYPGTETALSFPADFSSVVSVGAVDSTGTIASFSQRGPHLKVVAPGVDILSTIVTENVATNDGRGFPAVLPVAKTSNGNDLCLLPPSLTGSFVSCGFGASLADFPSVVAGNIALISRGSADDSAVTFTTKAKNAKAAGARAVILYNNSSSPVIPDLGTLVTANDVVPLCLISQSDGAALQATPSAQVTLSFGRLTYTSLQGTSMATPHAAAVGALVWAAAPDATNQQIMDALQANAKDLGPAGRDDTYGAGLVDAFATAKALNPAAFGNGAQPPPPQPPTGRRGLHRGSNS